VATRTFDALMTTDPAGIITEPVHRAFCYLHTVR